MSTTKFQREHAIKNAIKDASRITSQSQGASLDSEFFNQQLPPLARSQSPATDQLVVEFGDVLLLTRRMLRWHPEFTNQVMVLNMANDQQTAGGWETRAGQTQEDMLCYQSTLYASLKRSENVYPFRQHLAANERNGCGAIFSPAIVIYRDGPERIFGMVPTSERRVVSIVSVAAPFKPAIVKRAGQEQYSKPQQEVEMREKVRMICRIAVNKGKKVLVLGAFGCGFFGNPPLEVAQVMKEVVLEEEFAGHIAYVYWFINDQRMFDVFHQVIVTTSK